MGILFSLPRSTQKPEATRRVGEKLLKAEQPPLGPKAVRHSGLGPSSRSQRHATHLDCDRMLFYNPIAGVLLRRNRLSFSTAVAAAQRQSRMGAIVKNSGPVDTSERVKALRQLMEKEDVQA